MEEAIKEKLEFSGEMKLFHLKRNTLPAAASFLTRRTNATGPYAQPRDQYSLNTRKHEIPERLQVSGLKILQFINIELLHKREAALEGGIRVIG